MREPDADDEFSARVRRLLHASRTLLLLAAADTECGDMTVLRAARALRLPEEAPEWGLRSREHN